MLILARSKREATDAMRRYKMKLVAFVSQNCHLPVFLKFNVSFVFIFCN
jgi:hypothetical protein